MLTLSVIGHLEQSKRSPPVRVVASSRELISLPLSLSGVICGAINQLVRNNCLSQRPRVVLTYAAILAPVP